MDDAKFENLINQALETLPEEFSVKLENVSVVIADWPSRNQLSVLRHREQGRMLLGLYQGIPQTKRGRYGIGGPLPDKITIFKIPLMRISRSYAELKNNVRNTVIHEIGHHFGMSEEDILMAKNRKMGNPN